MMPETPSETSYITVDNKGAVWEQHSGDSNNTPGVFPLDFMFGRLAYFDVSVRCPLQPQYLARAAIQEAAETENLKKLSLLNGELHGEFQESPNVYSSMSVYYINIIIKTLMVSGFETGNASIVFWAMGLFRVPDVQFRLTIPTSL